MMGQPWRYPPPLGRTVRKADGSLSPVMERPFVECGQVVTLRNHGEVICIRESGHPAFIDWGHTNGYVEWCFGAPNVDK